jgi:decaprenylphospho-beta-D-ribofuranose 2-oxidase
MATTATRTLTGWGRTAGTVAEIADVPGRDVGAVVARAGRRGVIARGLGRSYGDAAQNAGGTVVRLSADVGDVHLDPATATVTAPGGLSLDALMRVLVPRGFFVPVTPGTRFVTVGGAIASDIHGKNHHRDGSIGSNLHSMQVLLASGDTIEVSPEDRPDLFWATVGGMGLTGIIRSATLALIPIETSRMIIDTDRLRHLDDLLAAMTTGDDGYRYSVAWIDPVARGRYLGRSVLTRGDHAPSAAVSTGDPLGFSPRQLVKLPAVVPGPGFINHATVSAFNEVWFRKAPMRRRDEVMSISAFFHPLDLVGRWNRAYGSGGMIQYQVVVPFGEEEALRTIIERLSANDTASFLAVLKRFGPGNDAPLSFPAPGWTLALDVPARTRGLADLLHGLDRLVLDAGGRHYFAKDSHTTRQAIERGYPRLAHWQDVQRSVDPYGVWQSDLARRLGLLAPQ